MHQHAFVNSTYTYTDILTEGRPGVVMPSFCVDVSRVYSPVAQRQLQLTVNQFVGGSNPSWGAKYGTVSA